MLSIYVFKLGKILDIDLVPCLKGSKILNSNLDACIFRLEDSNLVRLTMGLNLIGSSKDSSQAGMDSVPGPIG